MTTPRSITIDLPLPPAECSPNWRGHWAKRAKAAKQYREACGFAGVAARCAWERWHGTPWTPLAQATLALLFTYCGRCPDDDNALASFKAGRDALVDAGLIGGDDPAHLSLAGVSVVQTGEGRHMGWQCPAGVRATLTER
jgi:hypothetical protein